MSDQPGKESKVILCDMCPEERRTRAQKTCMKCEISMCLEHLRPHLTTPVLLQSHPLTEPVALDAAAKCPQHGKLLEYYCLDDLTQVCVSCAIEDQHRLHNMKTVSTAQIELKEKFVAEQRELTTRTGLEEWERVEKEKVKRSGVQLIGAVNQLRDLALTSVQTSVSARMVPIKTSRASIQALQQETDTFRFLQMCSQVHQDLEKAKAVDLRRGLEPGVKRDALLRELSQSGRKMVAQAEAFWKSLVVLVDPEDQGQIVSKCPWVTFDPVVSEPCMSLSEDKRKIFYSKFQGPKTQHSVFHLQSSKPDAPVSEVKNWVLSLSTDYGWTAGLCRQNYNGTNQDVVFGLCYADTFLKCVQGGNYNDISDSLHRSKLETFEVIWHPDSLSFFNLTKDHQRREVATIQLDRSHDDLTPFVCLQVEVRAQTRSVCGGFGQTTQPWTQWHCSCGQYHHFNYNYLNQSTCVCGRRVGGLCTTDLLCELL